jgi:hypothetical protein
LRPKSASHQHDRRLLSCAVHRHGLRLGAGTTGTRENLPEQPSACSTSRGT